MPYFGGLANRVKLASIFSPKLALKTFLTPPPLAHVNVPHKYKRPLHKMTLIGMRIAVRMAKSTHRTLSNMCGVRPRSTPVALSADGPADNGAGPRARAGDLGDSELRYLPDLPEEGEGIIGRTEGRGVLPWDPLTPRLVEGAQKLVTEGQARPVTAALVVAAALPFSGVAVCVGAPVLACDAGLQWGASTPVGRAVGQSTHNALEVIGRRVRC